MTDLFMNLSDSISTAISLCAEIKKTRHVGKSHAQLDLLEASLAFGPESLNLPSSISLSEIEASSKELQSYISQMATINSRLEHLAHPKKHGHAHHHRHEMQDPHFGELRGVWEKVRDGVEKLLAGEGGGEELTEELEVKLKIKEEVKNENQTELKKVEVKVEVKEKKKEDVKVEASAEAKSAPSKAPVKLETKHEADIKIEEVEQVNT